MVQHKCDLLHRIFEDSRYLWPLLLPVFYILMGANRFPYPGWGGPYSDITVTHYPNAYYLREALVRGEVPLWSSAIFSGYPFAASPLSGLWYLPGWLALVFPLPLGFNVVTALHILWGGLGMYSFLRQSGLGREASSFGGMAFTLMPKWIGHYGAGHLSLVYAFSWTPWLLTAVKACAQITATSRGVSSYPSVIFALIFLADVRWAAYAGVLWWAYRIAYSHHKIQALKTLSLQSILVALCIMPLAMPLLEYTNLSTRSALTPEDLFVFSLPLDRLLGLIYPDFAGSFELILYPGAVILCLGLLGVFLSLDKAEIRIWPLLGISSLLISAGILRPVSQLLTYIPGVAWMRVPSKAIFLAGLAFVVLSSFALEHLLLKRRIPYQKAIQRVWVALGGFALALTLGSGVIVRKLMPEFIWGSVALVLAVAWLMLGLKGLISRYPHFWYWGLLGLCLIDLGVMDRSLLSFRSPQEAFQEGKAAAQWLASQPGLFRVYSPSYSLPQHTAVRWGLQLADGVDPLQLKSYVTFMGHASGVPVTKYSVTLPPLEGDDPTQANASYAPDPTLLGLLNVRYVVSEFDIHGEGLILRQRLGQSRIYENLYALPRAWVQRADFPLGSSINPVRQLIWTPQHITIEADGPGLLVLSEVAYPGWRVWVDGQKAQVETVAGLFRGVVLVAGTHQVVFAFRPLSVYGGLVLGALGWILAIWLAIRGKRI